MMKRKCKGLRGMLALVKMKMRTRFSADFFSQQCYFEVMINYFAGVFNVILI